MFLIKDNWNAIVGSQKILGITSKFDLGVQNEAEQRLTQFCQQNMLQTPLFFNNSRNIYIWTSPEDYYPNQTDYVLCSQRRRSSIQSVKQDLKLTGSDYKLLIAKFRLKQKKVGKTTGPFRYNLNQISYDYIVEVMNRFKGLDLVDTVPEELWTEV